MDAEDKVKHFERHIKRLTASIRGCMLEKISFNKEINELKHVIETNKEFNENI